nr:hypothetical protein [Angustibacter aerolatus]
MTATYTFDVFCSLDGFAAAGGDWTGYWGKQGPEPAGAPAGAVRGGAAAGAGRHHVPAVHADARRQHRGLRRPRPVGDGDACAADHRAVDHPVRAARLAGRDRGGRRPGRRRPAAEGGVTGAAALARQPPAEPRAAGRRPGRPPAGHGVPGRHRPHRAAAGLRGRGGPRPRACWSSTSSTGARSRLTYRPTLHRPA